VRAVKPVNPVRTYTFEAPVFVTTMDFDPKPSAELAEVAVTLTETAEP
jgi:hypothetical protein